MGTAQLKKNCDAVIKKQQMCNAVAQNKTSSLSLAVVKVRSGQDNKASAGHDLRTWQQYHSVQYYSLLRPQTDCSRS